MAGFGSGTQGKEKLGIAHLRHGGYSYLRGGPMPGCNLCMIGKKGGCEKYDPTRDDCTIGLSAMDDMMRQITSLPWIRPEHSALVEEYARDRIFLFLCDRWLMVVSPFRTDDHGDLTARGILKMRWVVSNSMSRIAEQLGLTPSARKSLGLAINDEPEVIGAESVDALEARYKSNGKKDADET